MIEIRGWISETEAQAMADETGRVTYLSNHPLHAGKMTTDRDTAVKWQAMVAFVPKQYQGMGTRSQQMAEGPMAPFWDGRGKEYEKQPDPDMAEAQGDQRARLGDAAVLGGNLGVLAARVVRDNRLMDEIDEIEAAREPHVRVIRVLEYRGPKSWIERTLANSYVSETEPQSNRANEGRWEIVEQIRTTEPLGEFDE
jgi:hypothetical protein